MKSPRYSMRQGGDLPAGGLWIMGPWFLASRILVVEREQGLTFSLHHLVSFSQRPCEAAAINSPVVKLRTSN